MGFINPKPIVVSINPYNPQKRLIRIVVDILERGGIVSYPTDTSYGIGCSLYIKGSIQKIYNLKKRPLSSPFSFVCDSLSEISKYCIVSNYAYRVLNKVLPGPYTFILPGTKLVPKIMLTNRKTVGIRVPKNEVCIQLVKTLGNPIINTSAEEPDPLIIAERYKAYLDVVINAGIIPVEYSSVISLIDDVPKVLRVGKGDVSMFLAEGE
jgi:tRNA threonylcarbamoyl adenosine modification protein (Sua5/YciO/YrdC/YwlC family)